MATLAASLPAITGTFPGAPNRSPTGAFTVKTTWFGTKYDSNDVAYQEISFNAAKSNKIYNGINRVQPNALQLLLQIRY